MRSPLPADVHKALTDAHGRVLDVTALEGGLRNHSYRVRTADGSELAVRLPGKQSSLIERDAEVRHAIAAAEVGVAPKLDRSTSESGVLVFDFVGAPGLAPAELGDRRVLTRVARLVRRLHGTAGFGGHFDLAAARRAYVAEAAATGVEMPSWYGDLVSTVEAMEATLLADEPPVASHNDLVPANILDDGSRSWLIDFEYSALNVPSFDLGTLIAAGGLDRELSDHLVSTYWGERAAKHTAQARAWSLIQRYSYLPWARLQSAEVRRADPSCWAEGGPSGLVDLRVELKGWASSVLDWGS